MIAAGLAKIDITCFEPDMVMLGWGKLENRIAGVTAPLHARALVLRSGAQKVALLCADLGFISVALRQATVDRLALAGFSPHQVLLAGTHTHSGPSGFSHFLAYNATNFGFSKHVFDTLVDRFVQAVIEAERRLQPATLRMASAIIPLDEPVAFNRSPLAYNANRDTDPIDPRHPERATHRESVTLRIDRPDGRPLGAVNWFGVHASSIHSDNRWIDGDNKGRAAARFEREIPGEDFVALFFQEAAGDVSPNYRFDSRRGVHVGTHDDDRESAAANADIQARWALTAYELARSSDPIEGELGGIVEHVDFAKAYAGGDRTKPPVIGLGMAAGTDEGPGPLHPIAPVLRRITRVWRGEPKLPWLSMGQGALGRFLGIIPTRLGFHFVAPVEPIIAYVKAADDAGFVGGVPWVPSVLPVQIVRIGSLCIGAVPFEPTTVAGRRLRNVLSSVASRTVITTYANGYAGYVATEEEYRTQHYEGSATYFGARSLAALARSLSWLARAKIPAPHSRVFGPRLELLDEDFLIAQRKVGDAMRHRFMDPHPDVRGTPAQRGA